MKATGSPFILVSLLLAIGMTVTDLRHARANDSASVVLTPEVVSDIETVRQANVLATLSKFIKTEQFSSLKEVEELLDGEFKIDLEHSSAIHYRLTSRDGRWRAKAHVNIGPASPTGKPWLRTVEVNPEDICIREDALANFWFLEAQIPKEKSVFNRDGSIGWVKADIPHLTIDTRWSYSVTPYRGVGYWLTHYGAKTCASGFSFSFSPKLKD